MNQGSANPHLNSRLTNPFSRPGNNHFQLKKQHQKSQFMKEIQKYYISETIKLSLVTGPLYALSGHFQYLSMSTGFKLFKFSSFDKYLDLGRFAFREGILGLYKGNATRLLFFISSVKLKKELELTFDESLSKVLKYKIAKEILLFSLADMALNPFLFIESRYMIQSRRPNLSIYNNLLDVMRISYKELYKGSIMSLYRNTVFVLGLNIYFLAPSFLMNCVSIFIAHSLSYPILTIHRNIMARSQLLIYCESDLVSNQNRGFLRIKEIYQYYLTFGIQKLYKGFPLYISAIALWHYYVPSAAKYKYYQNLI